MGGTTDNNSEAAKMEQQHQTHRKLQSTRARTRLEQSQEGQEDARLRLVMDEPPPLSSHEEEGAAGFHEHEADTQQDERTSALPTARQVANEAIEESLSYLTGKHHKEIVDAIQPKLTQEEWVALNEERHAYFQASIQQEEWGRERTQMQQQMEEYRLQLQHQAETEASLKDELTQLKRTQRMVVKDRRSRDFREYSSPRLRLHQDFETDHREHGRDRSTHYYQRSYSPPPPSQPGTQRLPRLQPPENPASFSFGASADSTRTHGARFGAKFTSSAPTQRQPPRFPSRPQPASETQDPEDLANPFTNWGTTENSQPPPLDTSGSLDTSMKQLCQIVGAAVQAMASRGNGGSGGGGPKLSRFETGTSHDWEIWKEHFDTVRKCKKWNDEMSKGMLRTAVQGKALTKVRDVPWEDCDCDTLIQRFDGRFVTESDTAFSRIKFKKARQKSDETLLDWHNRLRDYYLMAYPGADTDDGIPSESLKEIFVKGLKSLDTAKEIMARRPYTYQQYLLAGQQSVAMRVMLDDHPQSKGKHALNALDGEEDFNEVTFKGKHKAQTEESDSEEEEASCKEVIANIKAAAACHACKSREHLRRDCPVAKAVLDGCLKANLLDIGMVKNLLGLNDKRDWKKDGKARRPDPPRRGFFKGGKKVNQLLAEIQHVLQRAARCPRRLLRHRGLRGGHRR